MTLKKGDFVTGLGEEEIGKVVSISSDRSSADVSYTKTNLSTTYTKEKSFPVNTLKKILFGRKK